MNYPEQFQDAVVRSLEDVGGLSRSFTIEGSSFWYKRIDNTVGFSFERMVNGETPQLPKANVQLMSTIGKMSITRIVSFCENPKAPNSTRIDAPPGYDTVKIELDELLCKHAFMAASSPQASRQSRFFLGELNDEEKAVGLKWQEDYNELQRCFEVREKNKRISSKLFMTRTTRRGSGPAAPIDRWGR